MPLILGTNSIKDTGFNVANSLRLNDGDSSYMHKTPGSAGDQQKFTFSFWIKRSNIETGTSMTLFDTQSDGDNQFKIRLNDNGTLTVESKVSDHNDSLITNQLFRDVSAWYSIIIAVDTTQGTASNRVKLYVNGTRVTSFATENYPAENLNTLVNAANKLYVGTSVGTNSFYDGYLAEFCLVDGSQLAETNFGEFDDDSPQIWKPKDVSGLSFGTNGFYLDFEASGNLGNDANGGTDLTEVNLAAADQATDTCTNNFCTMNSRTKTSATLSEGNLKQATAGNSSVATFGVSAGTWYFEQKILGGVNEAHLGFALDEAGIFSDAVTGSTVRGAGYVSLYSYDGKIYNESSATSSFATFAANDIVGFALDVDNGNVYLYQNGSALNSGNAVVSGKTGKTWFPFGNFDAGDVTGIEHNFGGCPSFSISSAQNDANGFGTFEYAPKSGYLSLCTKNLGSDGG